jgi:hypothetical protein
VRKTKQKKRGGGWDYLIRRFVVEIIDEVVPRGSFEKSFSCEVLEIGGLERDLRGLRCFDIFCGALGRFADPVEASSTNGDERSVATRFQTLLSACEILM